MSNTKQSTVSAMGEARPPKRAKLTHERNPFIDDEADVDHDDPSEVEDDEDEGFLEDEFGEELEDTTVYARVDATLRAEEAVTDARAGGEVGEQSEGIDEMGYRQDSSMQQREFADATSPLETDEQDWQPGTWAHMRGPKLYRGDIGFIFSRKNKTTGQSALWVALVPRIDIYMTQADRSSRPPPQTLNVKDVASLHDMRIDFGQDFFFQRKMFNYTGYLILRLEDANLYPAKAIKPMPLMEEFDRFLRLPALARKKWSEHRLSVWQQHSLANDRIKLQAGPYKGMVGILLGKTDNEAEIYLPAQDEVVEVAIADLQIELRHGDHVRVVNGEYTDRIGYITALNNEWVDICEPQEEIEIRVLALDVEFYKAPTVIQVKSHSFEVGDEVVTFSGPHQSTAGLVRAIHDGWLVVTRGSDIEPGRAAYHLPKDKQNRGDYKAYRGIVKVTHPDGRLGVQLDACLQQIINFPFDDVLVEEEKLAMALPPPVSAFTDKPPAIVPEHQARSMLFPNVDVEQTLTYPLSRQSTSAPTTSSEPQPLPLDHPSLKLPVPTWLLSGEFVPHRIRLVDITSDGPNLEYYQPAENGEEVLVRDGTTMRSILIKNLRHIMPEEALHLVIPLVGEFKGILMKVKEYGKDECSLTVNGAKRIRKKGYEFPRCRTQDLALTKPPRVQ